MATVSSATLNDILKKTKTISDSDLKHVQELQKTTGKRFSTVESGERRLPS